MSQKGYSVKTDVGYNWKDLPLPGRKAVQAYGLERLPKDLRWGYAEIPLGFLVEQVYHFHVANMMAAEKSSPPTIDEWIGSFNPNPTREWMITKPKSKWAIVLGGPPGGHYWGGIVIDDGWHRFQWYATHYDFDEPIPVVWGIH